MTTIDNNIDIQSLWCKAIARVSCVNNNYSIYSGLMTTQN